MTLPRRSDFPADFAWGTATASYQNEGSAYSHGKGASIWDVFTHRSGAISDGMTGDVATDHVRRYREDVQLMADLGMNSYRFSIAWPRVIPLGKGAISRPGLDFYRRLAEELLSKGITPYATLYHWDLPQALEEEGGWLVRDTAEHYADYAALVTRELGDVIKHWITLNEPFVSAFVGYAAGEHAPGRALGGTAFRAVHHLLLGHGLAVPRIRDAAPDATVGITVNLHPVHAVSDSPGDVDAAKRIDGIQNALFLDPLLLGKYPRDVIADLGMTEWFETDAARDESTIAAPVDFVGINYYHPMWISKGHEFTEPRAIFPTSEPVQFHQTDAPHTHMGWQISPGGIVDVMRLVHDRRPGLDIYITENGAAFDDLVEDGAIHDEERTAFLQGHIASCRDAIKEGLPLRGYFIWTLMDNFEWGWGYERKFGIVHVDHASQRRTIKDSGHWMRAFLHG